MSLYISLHVVIFNIHKYKFNCKLKSVSYQVEPVQLLTLDYNITF